MSSSNYIHWKKKNAWERSEGEEKLFLVSADKFPGMWRTSQPNSFLLKTLWAIDGSSFPCNRDGNHVLVPLFPKKGHTLISLSFSCYISSFFQNQLLFSWRQFLASTLSKPCRVRIGISLQRNATSAALSGTKEIRRVQVSWASFLNELPFFFFLSGQFLFHI